jgi:hypothetical protein
MRNAPDRIVRQHAHWLELLAEETTAAKLVLIERVQRAISGTGSGERNDRVQSSRGSSPVESAALQSAHHTRLLDQLAAGNQRIGEQISAQRRFIRTAIMYGPDIEEPAPTPSCKEGQHGKEGAIEWGDTTCDFPADKAGMCSKHYQAWRKHRIRNNIDTSKDFAA